MDNLIQLKQFPQPRLCILITWGAYLNSWWHPAPRSITSDSLGQHSGISSLQPSPGDCNVQPSREPPHWRLNTRGLVLSSWVHISSVTHTVSSALSNRSGKEWKRGRMKSFIISCSSPTLSGLDQAINGLIKQSTFIVFTLPQRSPTVLPPGTGFMEDNFSMGWAGVGVGEGTVSRRFKDVTFTVRCISILWQSQDTLPWLQG